jgi:hypothetical protein
VFGPLDEGVGHVLPNSYISFHSSRLSSNQIAEKIRYARFKAVDIMKALKEGRPPTAGPPASDQVCQYFVWFNSRQTM